MSPFSLSISRKSFQSLRHFITEPCQSDRALQLAPKSNQESTHFNNSSMLFKMQATHRTSALALQASRSPKMFRNLEYGPLL